MTNKLVTLIGGGGFLGRYVARELMRDGTRVRVAQRDPRQAYFLRTQGGLGQTQFVAADIARPDTVARAVEGADAVVNLVGVMGGNMQRIHVDGARAVAEAARAAGVTALAHVSAIGADANGQAAYARSKGEGETAVRQAFPNATILRPSIVFGREDQFVNRFAGMVSAPVVPILRAGVKFQPVFAGDVGEAIAAALRHPEAHGGRTYELGGPDVISMGELVRWIAQTLGRKPNFIELPDFAGALLARLPGSPISWDQWLMLQQDNVAAAGTPGLAELGVTPEPLAAVAPEYLVRFRKAGRFGRRTETLAA
ncbi:short chain dehydrogenase family protein [Sphingomonas sp. S17]|uniref:Complex I NDUFA9 subunit family protein n=2 Tax=Sphingomonas paucimobilis TaxID=13689 RepID=A0A411LK58_SPHPI|nr:MULTISPECIES: complex I NDUFA9 subunit family protein [Sphingomonas]EGI53749.1 short chain dehydrogenase family protein [Sphingomonas sp. S17]MBQ1480248.1 complex I NDUFA9 subunit family protein [Sphingomonas sp.]MCM3678819.1 complex I NDUFA9 subunit family protein [Sphingomonas paucimobilis]MDG5969848.1 complex I NDUFA9 subunit family protein [Sphingomonas paucimobilis]NNG58907.1 complex I NDUFA9 subunit family protein [Sphingomonas paucimobilis]